MAQPVLSQRFTEALRTILQTQTSLAVVDRLGDIHFEGEIIGYTTLPVALQGNETAALNRLTITVAVRFVNKQDTKQNFEQNFSRFADYESAASLSAIEENLIKEINDQLVQDIINKALTNW